LVLPDRSCTFCRIIRREIPAEVLYENDRVIAILDIQPIHYGHALVIPKHHCTDFLGIPDEDLYDVISTTQVIARALVRGLGVSGFNIFSNNGRIAGQSVFHFHMHVTPRHEDDNIRFVLQLKQYTGGAMAEYATRIRQQIS
jgi:histidine triad (HIT) family protein